MKSKYKTRDEVMRNKLISLLKDDTTKINEAMKIFKEFEEANIATINKFNRVKQMDVKKISGALKQSIQAHGPIDINNISSATKRIYGSVILEENCPKVSNTFSIRGIGLGIAISGFVLLIIKLISGLV